MQEMHYLLEMTYFLTAPTRGVRVLYFHGVNKTFAT